MIPLDHPDVQGVMSPSRGTREPRVALFLWPKAVSARHVIELPPRPGHYGSLVGRAAKTEARRLLREAMRARVNIGCRSKQELLKVIRGNRGLSYVAWTRVTDYLNDAIAAKRAASITPTFRVSLESGLQLRRPEPK